VDQTANELLLDSGIRRQMYSIRFANGLADRVTAALRESDEELKNILAGNLISVVGKPVYSDRSRTVLEKVSGLIRDLRKEAWKAARTLAVTDLKKTADLEIGYQQRALNEFSPFDLDLKTPDLADVHTIAASVPVDGVLVASMFSGMYAAEIDRILKAVNAGLVQNESLERVIRRVTGVRSQGYRDGVIRTSWNAIDRVVHTSVNHYQSIARGMFSRANRFITHELFVATLDGKTTRICARNDAKVFELDRGPVPPLHPNCRSRRVPHLNYSEIGGQRPYNSKTESRLIGEYAQKNNLSATTRKTLPHGHKKKYDEYARSRGRELVGPVPRKTSYDEFFRRQTVQFQNDFLGRERAIIYRRNNEHLDKFINDRGFLISFEQLEARGL